MDKRKEKTLKEIRKEIGLQMQDRRNFLNAILNVENLEKSIELEDKHIVSMKAELTSGFIKTKNNNGEIISKEQFEANITTEEFNLKRMRLALDYAKEDLYFKLYGKDGLIDKAGNIENIKKQIDGHFLLMREEYKKIKEKIGEKNAV